MDGAGPTGRIRRLRATVRALLADPVVRPRLTAAAISLGILLLALSVNWYTTSQVYFCSLCHEIRPEIRAWATSPHAEVDCYACHLAPGPWTFFRAKIHLAGDLYKHFLGLYEVPLHLPAGRRLLPSESCPLCHNPKRTVTPQPGIVIDHAIHPKKGIACTVCHNRVSHPGLRGYVDNMRMPRCFRCHGLQAGAKAPGKCTTCHTQAFDLKPPSHRTATWRVPDHGQIAKGNRKPCLLCHAPDFCSRCHGLAMPHPENWAADENLHARLGPQKPHLCRRCHPQRNTCDTCHHRRFRPAKGRPWVRQHFLIVRREGLYPCLDCHQGKDCLRCHVRLGGPPKATAQR